ncbi:MAG: hypothetical protein J7K26_00710 [Candidatus Aenigmarchaeota archaeon]|nr:hypothetical protein [Candidatus Aenigmarchaeota archaeon]
MRKSEKTYTNWYFLLVVIIIYSIIFVVNSNVIISSLSSSLKMFQNIFPVLLLVFVLITVINYYSKSKTLDKYLGKASGIKAWLISIIGGIISTGPIYMWYPLLNELQKRKIKNRYIATFLYNRAIKIPLIPLMIYYFGLSYLIVLTIVMIIFSIINGILVEKILEVTK